MSLVKLYVFHWLNFVEGRFLLVSTLFLKKLEIHLEKPDTGC